MLIRLLIAGASTRAAAHSAGCAGYDVVAWDAFADRDQHPRVEAHACAVHSGQPMAVVFSCVHCPYVVAWEDRLNDVARDYAGRAGLVAINSNAGYLGDGVEDMERRSQEKGFAFPFLYDETQDVASSYGAARTPEVFLFDDSFSALDGGFSGICDDCVKTGFLSRCVGSKSSLNHSPSTPRFGSSR